MKRWITADWHLGENRFKLMQRPFKTQSHMRDALINNHNELVAPDDLVYVVGDVCYQKTPEWLEHVKYFSGRKILFRGNHDKVFTDEILRPYFEEVVVEGEGRIIDVQGIPCNIVHYPSLAVKESFNLVGHIHAAWKFQLNSLNVGVDANHFRPLNIDEDVPFYLKAISEFYDQDVWVAYNSVNSDYQETRGKKSSYFNP